MKPYELLDHTADLGLRIYGASCAELFQNAGRALFDVITGIDRVRPMDTKRFSVEAAYADELLVAWLGRLLYVFDTELMVFSRFRLISFRETALVAEAAGEQLDDQRHDIKTEIKAVTYHGLQLAEHNGIWEATVILDV